MTGETNPSPGKGLRLTRGVPLILICLLVAGFCTLIVLAVLPNSSFAPPGESGDRIDARARQFERSFAAEFTRVRPSTEPWGIRIREEDLNAWLWVRLPDWVAHFEGVDAVAAQPLLQATLEGGRVRLMTRSLVFAFTPVVEAQRTRIQPAQGCSLGLLPLPGVLFGWTASAIDLDQLSSALVGVNDSSQTSAPVELGTTPVPGVSLPASFSLGDGRTVELLEVQTDDGALVLVFQTTP